MRLPIYASIISALLVVSASVVFIHQSYIQLRQTNKDQHQNILELSEQIRSTNEKIIALESEDQYVINQKLKNDLKETHEVFKKTVGTYEKLVDAKIVTKNQTLEKDFALTLTYLGDLNYASAEAKLIKITKDIDTAIAAAQVTKGIDIASLTSSQTPPGSGYQRQKVSVDGSEFIVDIVSGDLGSTKVVVDTASNESCGNDCPVLSVGEYAARNGAWAAINGSYFCPATYPSCAGKTNSFDLLLMNKNKTYFNSDNNVYSNNPAVIFQGGNVRFVGRSSEWGRDTGIDSMLSNYPLLVMNKSIQFGGNDDSKMSGNGNRSFVANIGNTVFIGVIRGVSVLGAAKVMQAMGMENAINLDSGGSTALWVNGTYKAGPGRNIPNAILFLRK
jgi:exopolysaccharide biosynthesis protein